MKITLQGAHLFCPKQQLSQVTDLHLAAGKILAIGAAPASFSPEQTIQAAGLVLAPGFIDLSCHLREPGPSYKGNLASESQAGVAGGFTHLCARPDTQPVLDSSALVITLQEKAQQLGKAKILPLGALTQGLEGKLLSNMAALKQAGCVALTNLRQPLENPQILRRSLEYAATYDLLVMVYPEDPYLKGKGCVNEGALATQLGLAGIPSSAETLALSQTLLLAEQTGAKVHFSHLSCAKSVELIAQAQQQGLPVTADVALSHLLFTDAEIEGFASNFHLQPPLRSEADRQALLAGLKNGVICAISSGHLPHEKAAKMTPFAVSEPGISSLETLLPKLLQLVETGVFSLEEALSFITSGPAKVLGLNLASLEVGKTANFTLFNPKQAWQLNEQTSFSAGQNTPFWQETLTGKVVACWVEGTPAYTSETYEKL